MKYFYSIVIDGYAYHEVTTYRYKNEIEFYYHVLPYNFMNAIASGYDNVWDYLDSEDCYPVGYVAVDENNNELKDTEGPNVTFKNIKKGQRERGKLNLEINE